MALEPRSSIIRRWMISTAAAILAHGGVAAWMIIDARSAEPDLEADGAAIAIDITAMAVPAAEEVASRVDEPRPEIAEQAAAPAETAEQPPPSVEKSELLVEQNSPEESDVLLPKPAEERKEEPEKAEEEQKPVPPQPQPVVATAAQEATAPTPVEAPPAPKTASPTQGITPSMRRSRNIWEKALVMHIDRHKRYPGAARAAKNVGEAVVEFVMDRSGAVLSRRLVMGSGSAALDAEALELLARAAPLPLPPVDVQGETFNLLVPIRFRLR